MRSKYSFQQYGLASETMLLDPRQRPRSTRMQQRILICFFFRRLFACRRLSCQSLPMRYHDFRARLIWKRRPRNSQLYFPQKCIALRAGQFWHVGSSLRDRDSSALAWPQMSELQFGGGKIIPFPAFSHVSAANLAVASWKEQVGTPKQVT